MAMVIAVLGAPSVALMQTGLLDWSGISGRFVATGWPLLELVVLGILTTPYLWYVSGPYGDEGDKVNGIEGERFVRQVGLAAALFALLIWLGDMSAGKTQLGLLLFALGTVAMAVHTGNRVQRIMYRKVATPEGAPKYWLDDVGILQNRCR